MKSSHKRNTKPMLASPRCGAKTRKGTTCMSPVVENKKRCRMHGGAKGSGAPKGNKNALKDGNYTRQNLLYQKFLTILFKTGPAGLIRAGYKERSHELDEGHRKTLDSLFEPEKIPDNYGNYE